MNSKLIFFLFLILVASCGPTRNLVYFSDLKNSTEYKAAIENTTEPKIQPDDLLSITVSSLNAESNLLFNNGVLQTSGPISINSTANKVNEGYLVDKNGFINYLVIGRIQLSGLTKIEATEKMTAELSKHVKEPIVNIRFLNFKITVIGEVNRPSSFIIPTDKINILEAIGLAGDMTAFGKRENVLVIREKDGERTTVRMNLNNKDVLDSPYFYLQQNDVVYIEPENKIKVAQSNPNNRFIPILSVTISAIAITLAALLR